MQRDAQLEQQAFCRDLFARRPGPPKTLRIGWTEDGTGQLAARDDPADGANALGLDALKGVVILDRSGLPAAARVLDRETEGRRLDGQCTRSARRRAAPRPCLSARLTAPPRRAARSRQHRAALRAQRALQPVRVRRVVSVSGHCVRLHPAQQGEPQLQRYARAERSGAAAAGRRRPRAAPARCSLLRDPVPFFYVMQEWESLEAYTHVGYLDNLARVRRLLIGTPPAW